MGTPRLLIRFDDTDAMRRELEDNLANGGTFATGEHGIGEGEECEVVLVHPVDGAERSLPAKAVWVSRGDNPGVGVAFAHFDGDVRAGLEAFIEEHAAPQSDAPGNTATARAEKRRLTRQNIQQRLRNLSVVEQRKIARGGNVTERVALERMYGKNVWPILLRNPRITLPEVIRIAGMRSLPRPQLELIIANRSWLTAPQIRRKILRHPKMTRELILKVLRVTPRNELRTLPKQTAYPSLVRDLARQVLR